jgi:hypothetical protein
LLLFFPYQAMLVSRLLQLTFAKIVSMAMGVLLLCKRLNAAAVPHEPPVLKAI